MTPKVYSALVGGLMLLIAPFIHAEHVTVNITGTVTGIFDPNGQEFGGAISIGTPVSGSYSYETNVPDSLPEPEAAEYMQDATRHGVSVDVGGFNFSSSTDAMHYGIGIGDNHYGSDYYRVHADLGNGQFFLDLYSANLNCVNSTELTTTAPDPGAFEHSTLNVDRNGAFIEITVTSLVAEVTPPPPTPDVAQFQLKATVEYVDDALGRLGGSIQPGTQIDGAYSYITDLIDEDLSPDMGFYKARSTVATLSLSAGGHVFEMDPTFGQLEIHVFDTQYSDQFDIVSFNNASLANGTAVQSIGLNMWDSTGVALQSDALPVNPPSLVDFNVAQITIYGDGFQISARITEIVAIPSAALQDVTVSPPTGDYLFPSSSGLSQRADGVFLVETRTAPIDMYQTQAILNGSDVSSQVRGCLLPATTLAGEEAYFCPDLTLLLAPFLVPGINQFEVKFFQIDGTLRSGSAAWNFR